MLKWIIFAILDILCMILCYLTNWFVVLFADENGELPKIFKLWQTWDGSLDDEEYVTENCWPILRYDFYAHYTPYRIKLNGQDKRCVVLIKPFTFKEKIQRYFARVCWLYRNCGYGFAYYLFGIDVNGKDMVLRKHKEQQWIDGKQRESNLYVKNNGNILIKPFTYKSDYPINDKVRWNNYLGWKIKTDKCYHRAMIAHRIAIRFPKKK